MNSEEEVYCMYCTYVTIGKGLAGTGRGRVLLMGKWEGVGCIVQVHTYGERNLGGKLVVRRRCCEV